MRPYNIEKTNKIAPITTNGKADLPPLRKIADRITVPPIITALGVPNIALENRLILRLFIVPSLYYYFYLKLLHPTYLKAY